MKKETATNHSTGERHAVKACRSCSAPIVLLQSKAGKWYPADAILWTASTEGSFGERNSYYAVQPWRGMHQCSQAPAPAVDTQDEARTLLDALRDAQDEAEERYGLDSPEWLEAREARRQAFKNLKG